MPRDHQTTRPRASKNAPNSHRWQSLLNTPGLFRSVSSEVSTHDDVNAANCVRVRTNGIWARFTVADAIPCKIGNEAVIKSSNFPIVSLTFPPYARRSSVHLRSSRELARPWPDEGSKEQERSGLPRNIVATPQGQTVLNRAGKKADTRVQNPPRPGRVDSLANFQIYALAVRSRAACFERRSGVSVSLGLGWDRITGPHAAQCSTFLRVRASDNVYKQPLNLHSLEVMFIACGVEIPEKFDFVLNNYYVSILSSMLHHVSSEGTSRKDERRH